MSTSNLKPHERLFAFDADLRQKHQGHICGVDEAGRGAWAGPIVAAACVLPVDASFKGINDSKQLSETARDRLVIEIKEKALAYHIQAYDAVYIDKYGLNPANVDVMSNAAKVVTEQLGEIALYVVDQSPGFKLSPFHMMSKADATSLCVAAASILAKTYRDALMIGLSKNFPGYGWEENKGYINDDHKNGVLRLGLTKLHRHSYKVSGVTVPKQMSFDDLL